MSRDETIPQPQIGILKESSLHASLKALYTRPGDKQEANVLGYLVDIIRDDMLIEIQTANFGALKSKLNDLLASYPVLVVFPVAKERWIQRVSSDGEPIQRRKSPKNGRVEDVFSELLRIPAAARRPNFSLEVVLTREEIVWSDDGRGSWRRKGWSITDRRLLEVIHQERFNSREDFIGVLPEDLPAVFTNWQLAESLGIRPRLAQQITYCLRRMGFLEVKGKSGRYLLYKTVFGPSDQT